MIARGVAAVLGMVLAAGAGCGTHETGGAGEPLILFDGHDRPHGFEFPTGSGIYVVRADGTGLRKLVNRADAFPVWSPDGTRVAYDQVTGRSCDGCGDVYVIAVDGGPPRRISATGSNSGPAWSPAGDVIAFTRCVDVIDGPCGIQAVAPDGTGRRWLAKGEASDPLWSPDGTRIAYERSVGGIWVMAADGTGHRRLTRRTRRTSDFSPVWSPDGTRIAFQRQTLLGRQRARHDVYVIGADGTGLRRVVRGGGAAWSPDGRWISFVSERHGKRLCSEYAIELVAPDGSGRRRITPYRAVPYHGPVWSPDGEQLLYARVRRCWGERLSLYVINADGTNERRLTPGDPEPDVSWSWQPRLG